MSWRNLKRLSFYFTKVLDELEKYLELFDEYSDLKEPSCNVFFLFLKKRNTFLQTLSYCTLETLDHNFEY